MAEKLIQNLRELPPGTVLKKGETEWYIYKFHELSGITYARDPNVGTCIKEFLTLLKHNKEIG